MFEVSTVRATSVFSQQPAAVETTSMLTQTLRRLRARSPTLPEPQLGSRAQRSAQALRNPPATTPATTLRPAIRLKAQGEAVSMTQEGALEASSAVRAQTGRRVQFALEEMNKRQASRQQLQGRRLRFLVNKSQELDTARAQSTRVLPTLEQALKGYAAEQDAALPKIELGQELRKTAEKADQLTQGVADRLAEFNERVASGAPARAPRVRRTRAEATPVARRQGFTAKLKASVRSVFFGSAKPKTDLSSV